MTKIPRNRKYICKHFNDWSLKKEIKIAFCCQNLLLSSNPKTNSWKYTQQLKAGDSYIFFCLSILYMSIKPSRSVKFDFEMVLFNMSNCWNIDTDEFHAPGDIAMLKSRWFSSSCLFWLFWLLVSNTVYGCNTCMFHCGSREPET